MSSTSCAEADGDRPRLVRPTARRGSRSARSRPVLVVGRRRPQRRARSGEAAAAAATPPDRRRAARPPRPPKSARDRVDVVVAGHQTPDPVLALDRRSAPCRPASAGVRPAGTGSASRAPSRRASASPSSSNTWPAIDAAARQPELDALELLAVGELQRRAGLQRPPLAVRQRDEAGLRHRERVASRRQLGEIEDAAVVGERAAAVRQLGGGRRTRARA